MKKKRTTGAISYYCVCISIVDLLIYKDENTRDEVRDVSLYTQKKKYR